MTWKVKLLFQPTVSHAGDSDHEFEHLEAPDPAELAQYQSGQVSFFANNGLLVVFLINYLPNNSGSFNGVPEVLLSWSYFRRLISLMRNVTGHWSRKIGSLWNSVRLVSVSFSWTSMSPISLWKSHFSKNRAPRASLSYAF